MLTTSSKVTIYRIQTQSSRWKKKALLTSFSIECACLFLTAHLKKLMSDETCSAEKATEMEDVITQVGALQTLANLSFTDTKRLNVLRI